MHPPTVETYENLRVVSTYDHQCLRFWKDFPPEIIESFKGKLPQDQRPVIDVGAGTGRGALRLRQAGVNVVCLDASSAMADRCKKLGFPSIVADFMTLPFPNQKVRGLWIFKSLVHIPKHSLPQALEEMRRVLDDRGVMALSMLEGFNERVSNIVGKPRLNAYYTLPELRGYTEAAGFRNIYETSLKYHRSGYITFLSVKS